jgi:AcrR family transcriptional regulator
MSEKRARGRPRREGTDEEILRAARQLLDEVGYSAFNVDTIVERTGIAKTTIYRRWPSKGALIAATIDAPTSATDTTAILQETATLLALLHGPDVDAIHVIRAIIEPRRQRLREALAPREDAAAIADMLLGALLTRLIVGDPNLTIADLIGSVRA